MAKENNLGSSKKKNDTQIKSQETNQIHYLGHRQRLKERLIQEGNVLPDYEIMELLLGLVVLRKDIKPLAKELLHRFGSVRGCLTAKKGELESIKGFGPSLSALFVLQQEIIARYMVGTVKDKERILTLKDMVNIAHSKLSSLSTEEVWLGTVDNQNRLLTFEYVTRGGVDNVLVQVRHIVELALKRKASGIFLMHNHPGGDYEPSFRDVEFTKNVSSIAEKIGIRFLEHIVVTDKGCACMLAQTFVHV